MRYNVKWQWQGDTLLIAQVNSEHEARALRDRVFREDGIRAWVERVILDEFPIAMRIEWGD